MCPCSRDNIDVRAEINTWAGGIGVVDVVVAINIACRVQIESCVGVGRIRRVFFIQI